MIWLLILFVALIFVWQWQFGSFDPVRRRPSRLQRAFGIRWTSWESMAWEEKMAVHARYRMANWVWTVLTLVVFVLLAAEGLRHGLWLQRLGR